MGKKRKINKDQEEEEEEESESKEEEKGAKNNNNEQREEDEYPKDNDQSYEEGEVPKKATNGVFISGIPYTTKEEELQKLFSKFGTIQQIKLPKYQDSGNNIGYCHIYYDKIKNAKAALSMNNYELGNRYLTVKMANQNSDELTTTTKKDLSSIPSSCLTAFIKNLPYDANETDVGDKFRSCGKIKSIRFVYNSQTKKFKGFCFIDFVEHKSLIKALELNGKQFQGRKLYVDYEEGKAKKGYKYNKDKLSSKYNKEHMTMLNRKRKKNK